MSKIHKLPAIQFYVGDWRKDPSVQSLNYHDRGVWFEMICLMHESEERGKLVLNGQPMPIDALARLLGLDKQILTTTLTTLIEYGVASQCPDTGIISNRRMIRDEEIRKIRANAGKLGGNPVLVKQKSTTKDKQISTPSTSLSSSTSISTTIHTTPPQESACVIESPFLDSPPEASLTMQQIMDKINELRPAWKRVPRWNRNEMESLRNGSASQIESLTDDDWNLLKAFYAAPDDKAWFKFEQRHKFCENLSSTLATADKWKNATGYRAPNSRDSLYYGS
jgi:hypothetical protein